MELPRHARALRTSGTHQAPFGYFLPPNMDNCLKIVPKIVSSEKNIILTIVSGEGGTITS